MKKIDSVMVEKNQAPRYFSVGVALSVETLQMVDILARNQERNRSQAIRWLIREASKTANADKQEA